MTSTASLSLMAQCLHNAQHVLAVAHINPDGDAVGSLAALGHLAKALDKDLRLYCATRLPEHFSWLDLPAPLVHSLNKLGTWRPDLVACVDGADQHRCGPEIERIVSLPPDQRPYVTACIDHHADNPHFADINLIDPEQPATGILLALLAKELGIPLAGGLGEAIYLAIVDDTGSFSFANTNAQCLALASEIVGNGLSVSAFTAKYENHWSRNRLHLWGKLLQEVELHAHGAIAVSIVTQAHLDHTGAHRADLENFASWLRRIKGVRVVLLARVSSAGAKVSLRSMGDVDVRLAAAKFGGGGHIAAAGIEMRTSPEQAAALVLPELQQLIAGQD